MYLYLYIKCIYFYDSIDHTCIFSFHWFNFRRNERLLHGGRGRSGIVNWEGKRGVLMRKWRRKDNRADEEFTSVNIPKFLGVWVPRKPLCFTGQHGVWVRLKRNRFQGLGLPWKKQKILEGRNRTREGREVWGGEWRQATGKQWFGGV